MFAETDDLVGKYKYVDTYKSHFIEAEVMVVMVAAIMGFVCLSPEGLYRCMELCGWMVLLCWILFWVTGFLIMYAAKAARLFL